jgi:hypothetical protein
MNDDDFTASNATPATMFEFSLIAGVWMFVLLVIYFSWTGVENAKDLYGCFFGYDGF